LFQERIINTGTSLTHQGVHFKLRMWILRLQLSLMWHHMYHNFHIRFVRWNTHST
jgi:hypothetical protein